MICSDSRRTLGWVSPYTSIDVWPENAHANTVYPQSCRRMTPNKSFATKVQAALSPRLLLVFAAASLLLGESTPNCGAADAGEPTLLTNAQQILDLGLDRARGSMLPASLRGVLTYTSGEYPGWAYVQDATAGMLCICTNLDFRAAAGSLVEMEGVVEAGALAPYVKQARARVVGEAPLPEPRRAPARRLAAGTNFGQWSLLSGTVRDAATSSNRTTLLMSSEGQSFALWIEQENPTHLPTEWLDAVIEARGIPWPFTDSASRPSGFRFHVPSTNFIRVLRPGSADVFERATPRTVASLRQISSDLDTRVKVNIVITHYSSGGWMFGQDETGTLGLEAFGGISRSDPKSRYTNRSRPPLRVGDRIEAVGSYKPGRPFAPSLVNAEYRVIGRGELPEPKPMSGSDGLAGRMDAEYVRVEARLVDREQGRGGGTLFNNTLWLQSEGALFEALIQTKDGPANLQLPKNSLLAVTGVCSVQVGELGQVRSFRVHLDDVSNVEVLSEPSPGLSAPTLKILGGAAVLALAASGWIFLLRREVSARTAELADANVHLKQAEQELLKSLAQEKQLNELKSSFVSMVSHEFRTPLGIIGSSAQILERYFERLEAGERVDHLQSISKSVRRMSGLMEEVLVLSKVEAGQMAFKPEEVDLPKVCRRLTDEVLSATHGQCPIVLDCSALPPASADEGLLRHILTNLLSNAVKYSPPGKPVQFRLSARDGDAVFTVRDEGLGIPATDRERLFKAFHRGQNASRVPGTGLGLSIVKRCVELHGGEITFESQEGKGTTFTVKLPVFEARPKNHSTTPSTSH